MRKLLVLLLSCPLALTGALALAASVAAPASPLALQAQPQPQLRWPHGARVAVSLAYDDALDSQLDVALPALQRHGLQASFYLQLSNPSVERRLGAWRRAARQGHELGNHSLFHQCAGSTPGHEWVVPQRDLDHTTAAQMRDQVLTANTMLYAIDGQRERTYTVPCGETLASGEDYLPLIAPAFLGMKVAGGVAVTARAALRPAAVQVLAPVGLSGAQLIALVRSAAAEGDLVNLTFHGVGGDYLSISAEAHEALLAYLASHRAQYWTTTFRNIMRHVQAQNRPPAAP